MRNNQVLEMLNEKFGNRAKRTSYIMNEQEREFYQQAQAKGNVAEMIKLKTGMYYKEQRQRAFEEELQNIDIEKVVKELREIEPKKEKIEKQITDMIEQETEKIKQEFEAEQQKLFRKGVQHGSIRYLLLQDEYDKKLEAILQHPKVLEMQRELFELRERQQQLEYLKQKFREDNKELIEELKREKIKRQLKELDLID
jgi:hypothetical protein